MQEFFDDELIKQISKSNRKKCFCIKKKISRELHDRVVDRLKDEKANKRSNFQVRAAMQNIDLERIKKSGENKEVDEYGKIYLPKEHHSPFRKKLIVLQN